MRSHAQKFIEKLFSKAKLGRQPSLKMIKYMKMTKDELASRLGDKLPEEKILEEILIENLTKSCKIKDFSGKIVPRKLDKPLFVIKKVQSSVLTSVTRWEEHFELSKSMNCDMMFDKLPEFTNWIEVECFDSLEGVREMNFF